MIMKAKRIISMLLVIALLACTPGITALAQSNIKVTLNGTLLSFDVPPQTIDGRTMVPMRAIFEALGAEVRWDGATQTIRATEGEKVITMQLGNPRMTIDGKELILDVPPQTVNGRTMVPVRAVSEGLDADVTWVSSTRTVEIKKGMFGPAEILAALPAMMPELAASNGYGNSLLYETQYFVRHFFEQELLPDAIYENSDAVIDILKTSDLAELEQNIWFLWIVVAATIVEGVLHTLGDLDSTGSPNDKTAFIFSRIIDYGLEPDNHVLDITIENVAKGGKAAIIKMSEPGWSLLCTYIAIVYVESLGLQIFTLERGYDSDSHFFCYIGEHDWGVIDKIDNSRSAFLRAINEEINALG